MVTLEKLYWTDMHSNIHHENFSQLKQWFEHIESLMDFWPIAYYPYFMRATSSGLKVEDFHDLDKIKADWESLRQFVNEVNAKGFAMFMGYEWQGAGLDGDHNVFFKDNNQDVNFPYRLNELYEIYKDKDAIAIPHHMAYQKGSRGKNWDTHIEVFSPFAEIYSSHGSSENDTDSIPMSRHIHMGPRTGQTVIERGWEKGYQYGVIASGDNHLVPGVSEFGTMGCWAKSNRKEDLWDAMLHRRVYGVSRDRIQLDFQLNGQPMGSETMANEHSLFEMQVVGSNTLDRIEVIGDGRVIDVIPMIQSQKSLTDDQLVRFKVKIEFGWGPDRRIFPDIASKIWEGLFRVDGKILSIEKCWNNFGQKIHHQDDHSFSFTCTSYKTATNEKWMGTSAITTEGFIVEVESTYKESVQLIVDGEEYVLPIASLFASSQLFDLKEQAKDLINNQYGFSEYYRNDSWWHNSYKFKVSQAAYHDEYEVSLSKTIDTRQLSHLRCRVWQRNGSVAWSSPIFIRKEEQ